MFKLLRLKVSSVGRYQMQHSHNLHGIHKSVGYLGHLPKNLVRLAMSVIQKDCN